MATAVSFPLKLHQWVPPAGWSGPLPIIYRSFDSLDSFVLMKGNNETNCTFLLSGQVCRKIIDVTCIFRMTVRDCYRNIIKYNIVLSHNVIMMKCLNDIMMAFSVSKIPTNDCSLK